MQSRSTQRWVRLVVEELESRNLLSGGSVLAQPLLPNASLALQSLPEGKAPTPVFLANAFQQLLLSNGSALKSEVDVSDALTEQPYSSPILATPEPTPESDSFWGAEIALDVECTQAITPGVTIFRVDARPDYLSELLPAVVYAPNEAIEDGSVWFLNPPADLAAETLLEPIPGAVGIAPPSSPAGQQPPSVFSSLENGDWQGMVESTWGYRPGHSISSELARTVHYAKADVSDSGPEGEMLGEAMMDLPAGDPGFDIL